MNNSSISQQGTTHVRGKAGVKLPFLCTSDDLVVVYAYVAGDLFHKGHRLALKQAKLLGDYLIVGVLTDDAIAAYKRWPVIPFAERLGMVQDLRYVDQAVVQESLDPTPNLMQYAPDIVVHGDDWEDDFPGAEYMRSIGGRTVRTTYYPHQSTTKIIETIRQRIEGGSL